MRHVLRCTLILLSLLPGAASAEDKFFNSNGVRIRYVDQGTGEPLVLAHGYTNAIERNWIETGVLPNLVKNYRVIAFDLRGHGKSDKPHDPKAYGDEMAQDIVRLLDHLKIARAHVVGYSYGGRITIKLLTSNPDRFVSAALIAASGQRRWTEEDERSAEATAKELEGDQPYRSMNSPEIRARNDPQAHAAMWRAGRGLAVTDAQIAAVRVPTLAVVGTADPIALGVRTLKAAWPALEMVVVEGATHWGDQGILLRPEFITSLRSFLAAHRSTSPK